MDLELVDQVDINGKIINQVLKTEAHKKGLLHKTVIGGLRFNDRWALVRQASDRQDAGQLVAPVGGHVTAGETEIEALLRESEEEIGTRNTEYKLIGRARFRRNVLGRDENHMFVVYEISTQDKITLGHEAVSIEEFTPEQLKEALKSNPHDFGDALYFTLENFYPDFLPSGYQYKWAAKGKRV